MLNAIRISLRFKLNSLSKFQIVRNFVTESSPRGRLIPGGYRKRRSPGLRSIAVRSVYTIYSSTPASDSLNHVELH